MIVITSLNEDVFYVCSGDTFSLVVTDEGEEKTVISEEIITNRVINFSASYRFALEDGTCVGFHLCGIFANKDDLPREIEEAVRVQDLTCEQLENFINSAGIGIE